MRITSTGLIPILLMLAGAGCSDDSSGDPLQDKVDTIVVIYAENRGFDNMYGAFPGANGIPSTGLVAQKDRDASGTALTDLPMTWGGVTAPGQTPVVSQMDSGGLPNEPFDVESAFGIAQATITRDLYHRFFENQMQIDGGKNDKFVAFADSGGLVMGNYDGSKMALWNVAKDNVLADNFFQAVFGGSFLNHQHLICACAPEYPNADTAPTTPPIALTVLDMNGTSFTSNLTIKTGSPASAMDGPPMFVNSGAITPKNYFGDNTFRAVNTMQPPYQPSANAPAASDASKKFADTSKPNTLPPQTQQTIGDQLDAKSVTWAWYAGAWNSTLTAATTDRNFGSSTPGAAPQFQFHHQPFNYYAKFDPTTGAAARTAHLKDYTDLVADAAAGKLPQVVFYKPEGDLNQHAGYASLQVGDAHIADVITKLQASPQYSKMVIVVTYDENGGWWDHAAPPVGDLLGPGSRIPAIIISPFAKTSFVDHTPYDTGSVQRFLNKRFGLNPLPGIVARDQ